MTYIRRKIESKCLRLASQYPVVIITGPRQSGKTTLCRTIFPEKPYVSLENVDIRHEAIEDPNGFLRKFPNGAILDEIQRAPDLVSYIQTIVDEQDKEGLFILTGSQNFMIMHQTSQSLAGRAALLTLLPLCMDELPAAIKKEPLENILFQGFYPRVIEKNLNPTEAMAFYTDTYLQRDIRDLLQIKNLMTFTRFLKVCATRTGQVLNVQSMALDCGISHNTANQWLSLLEASYIITLVRPHYANLGKRITKSPKLHFLDSALVCYLLGITSPDILRSHPLKGAIFESFVGAELLKNQLEFPYASMVYYFRENNNHEIDFIVENGTEWVPIEAKSTETYSSGMLKNLKWYEAKNLEIKRSYAIYAGDNERDIGAITLINFRNIASIFS